MRCGRRRTKPALTPLRRRSARGSAGDSYLLTRGGSMGPSHLGRLAVGDEGPLVMTIGGEVDDPVVGV